jgi:hypothetical protein
MVLRIGGRIRGIPIAADPAGPEAPEGATAEPGSGTSEPTATDLGPRGADVLALLARAARLTPEERGRLAREAGWRWWPVSLPGGGITAAHGAALARARQAGRGRAVAWLDVAVGRALGESAGRRSRIHQAVASAALGLAAADLVADDVLEVLLGPWRAIVH